MPSDLSRRLTFDLRSEERRLIIADLAGERLEAVVEELPNSPTDDSDAACLA